MRRLVAVIAALTLTGCGSAGSGAGEPDGHGGTTSAAVAAPATGFNPTDVMFGGDNFREVAPMSATPAVHHGTS